MIVRPAEPRDDEVLLRIESMAGQGDRIRLIDERDSFFSRARQFDNTILLVGENEATGALHGVVAAAVQRLIVAGQERLGAYMFDLRSNPEVNKGLSRAMFFLWRGLEERLMEQGVEFIFGLIKEDNSRSYSIAQRMGAKACGERRFLRSRPSAAEGRCGKSRSRAGWTRARSTRPSEHTMPTSICYPL